MTHINVIGGDKVNKNRRVGDNLFTFNCFFICNAFPYLSGVFQISMSGYKYYTS